MVETLHLKRDVLALIVKFYVSSKETREGWRPLLTAETEVNGNSKSTNERGPRWAYRVGTRESWSALDALVGPVEHIFFLTGH
jgi:hypothetical protein